MMNIRWKYVGAFTIGLLFLLSFSKAIFSFAELNSREEKFLFIYNDLEQAENLIEKSALYDITCESWLPKEDSVSSRLLSKKQQEMAGLITVREADAFSYPKIMNFFRDSNGKIELDLMKWLQRFCLVIFMAGMTGVLLAAQKKEGNRKVRFGIVILVWVIFMRCIPGSFRFPVWALPKKWSDFAGWRNQGAEIGRQLLTMVNNQDIPIVKQCYTDIYEAAIFLLLSFILFWFYYKCCLKLHQDMALHVSLSIVALGLYIVCSNPDMKAVVYYFPCFAFSKKILESQKPH